MKVPKLMNQKRTPGLKGDAAPPPPPQMLQMNWHVFVLPAFSKRIAYEMNFLDLFQN